MEVKVGRPGLIYGAELIGKRGKDSPWVSRSTGEPFERRFRRLERSAAVERLERFEQRGLV